MKKCKYCEYETDNSLKLGGHVVNCKQNPNYKDRIDKLSKLRKGVSHTEESKKKISDSRKDYLKNNPDKVPYLLNHSRNESYPELYFTDVFNKNNVDITKFYRIALYELDFCILDKKIDIEIDGEQHYLDVKIIESDKRRNKYLEELGWDIIRIRWADYKLLDGLSKKEYINNLISYINGLIENKPTFEIPDRNKYCKCGKIIYKDSKSCMECYSIRQRKVDRPSLEQLLIDIKNTNYVLTGKKYGVSDNAIRKWIKKYEKG